MTSRIDGISNLVQELLRCGAYISENDIKFQGDSDSNIGMVAAREVKSGTTLMGIPAHAILIPRTGHQSKYGKELLRICRENGDGSLNDIVSRKQSTFLALAMLEGLRSSEPPSNVAAAEDDGRITAHHMKSLPQEKDLQTMPTFWTSDDRSILRNCCGEFDLSVDAESKVWHDEYTLLCTLLEDFPFTKQDWLWARANIVSRNMQIPSSIFNSVFTNEEGCAQSKSQKKRNKGKTVPVVVPLADMANHSNTPTVTWRLDRDEKMFEMRSVKPMNIGDEICFDYGHQATSKYLLHYGFIPEDQTSHCVLETTITVERTAEVLIRSDSGAGFDSLMAACRTLTNSPESLSTRVNESAAVEVAHKALRGRMTQRLQCVRYIGQHKATSPAAPSLTALLQGENAFLRSLVRVLEDASLYLCGGEEASDIASEYGDNWGGSQVWKRHVQFAPSYFASLAQSPE